jgi:hypothetical protein
MEASDRKEVDDHAEAGEAAGGAQELVAAGYPRDQIRKFVSGAIPISLAP